MKRNMFVSVLFMVLAGLLSFNSFAEDMQPAEDVIKAECREDSKNAESPEIYYEECVADRLQALKDEQGGSNESQSEKG